MTEQLKPEFIMGGDGLYAGIDEDDAAEINFPCMLISLPNEGDFAKMREVLENWDELTNLSNPLPIDQSERIKELEQSLSTMTHAAKELYGVISEHSLMPCRSLETRMMSTANRYATRIFGE